jgi:hypothetical protein
MLPLRLGHFCGCAPRAHKNVPVLTVVATAIFIRSKFSDTRLNPRLIYSVLLSNDEPFMMNHYGSALVAANCSTNRVQFWSLSAQMLPPKYSAMRLTKAKPSPVPPVCQASVPGTR